MSTSLRDKMRKTLRGANYRTVGDDVRSLKNPREMSLVTSAPTGFCLWILVFLALGWMSLSGSEQPPSPRAAGTRIKRETPAASYPDGGPAASPTERQRLLCHWFARNQKRLW